MPEPLTARVFKKRERFIWSCDACQEMMPGARVRTERTAAIAAAYHNVKHGDTRIGLALGKHDPVTVTAAACPKHGSVEAAVGFAPMVLWQTLLRPLPLEATSDQLGINAPRCPRCDAALTLTIGGSR